jgi:aspartyl-tRNA(Asn)/glutamyl-tRNA(Gln) amidotransferase subunit A
MSDPCLLTMTEQARLIASGQLSSVALTMAHLDRITALDGQLRSYTTVAREQALADAAKADAERAAGVARGPLDGLPLGIKDLIDVAGLPTIAGAAHRRDHIATTEAPVVAALRRAGAIILGKTATAEYAVGGTVLNGPFASPRNPWNLDCDASSSSSGSAVATAAGLCSGSVGTETAGSIRVPAAWCGVAGLVPTQALISRQGVLPLSRTVDCVGPIARAAADCALMLQGMITDDPADRAVPGFRLPDLTRLSASCKGLRIGVPRHVFEEDPDLDPEVRAAFASTLVRLRDLGCRLTDVTLDGYDSWADAARAITWPEEYAEHGAELRDYPERFSAVARSRLQDGLRFSAPDHVLALRHRALVTKTLDRVLQVVDLLVLPTTKAPAQPFGYEHQPGARDVSYTRPFNLTGNPMLALCSGFSSKGLPLSFQFVGRPFEDDLVLATGMALEAQNHDRFLDLSSLPDASPRSA